MAAAAGRKGSGCDRPGGGSATGRAERWLGPAVVGGRRTPLAVRAVEGQPVLRRDADRRQSDRRPAAQAGATGARVDVVAAARPDVARGDLDAADTGGVEQ